MTAKRNSINDPSNDILTIGQDNPASFDLSAWLTGIRPNRASVPVYGRPDLADDIQAARRRLQTMDIQSQGRPVERGLDDPTPDSIRAEIDQLVQEYEASKAVFVVEGRSTDRRNKVADDLKKQGIDDPTEIGLHLLADAIVEPQGVTVDLLRRMNETLEPQLSAVATASQEINLGVPQVSRDFSSRSSGNRGTRTS